MKIELIKHSPNGFIGSRDVAFEIRKKFEDLLISGNDEIVFDFLDISSVTQSSIDELIGVFITHEGLEILQRMSFSNCSEKIKNVIRFVINDRISKLKRNIQHI